MGVAQRIESIIAPSLEAMGYRLVQVKLGEGGKRKQLQVMAERKSGGMTLDDCTEVSRTVAALLDVEDPINGAYQLEVSSPGIDRPLKTPEEFEKYLGFEAKVESVLPVEGRRRFRGPITLVHLDCIHVTIDGVNYELAYDNIESARLVLSDALIKAHQETV